MRGFEQVPHDLICDRRLSVGARAFYPLLRRLAWDAGRREPEDAVPLPTISEIAEAFACAESTARVYVGELRKSGWIETSRAARNRPQLWVIRDSFRAPNSGAQDDTLSAEYRRSSPPNFGAHPSSLTDVGIQGTSSPPTDVGEEAWTRHDLMVALGVALKVDLAGRTKRERRQWELAADDLVGVGASPDDVIARVRAWPWPGTPGPLAIVGHWSHLGTLVEATPASGFVAWLERAPSLFDRQGAHDVIDDSRLDDAERARRHALIDERYTALDQTDDESEAA